MKHVPAKLGAGSTVGTVFAFFRCHYIPHSSSKTRILLLVMPLGVLEGERTSRNCATLKVSNTTAKLLTECFLHYINSDTPTILSFMWYFITSV